MEKQDSVEQEKAHKGIQFCLNNLVEDIGMVVTYGVGAYFFKLLFKLVSIKLKGQNLLNLNTSFNSVKQNKLVLNMIDYFHYHYRYVSFEV